MKIIYEDQVDWEPLEMRFLVKGTPTTKRSQAVADFVVEWMRTRERADPQKWHFCEYQAAVLSSGTIEAFCELMPADEIESLAGAVADAFPFVSELRLGRALTSSGSMARIDWFDVPAGTVVVDGESFHVAAFSISLTAVTAGQFCQFLDATGYTPVPDTIEYLGYTIGHFKLNFGQSPKIPLFGVTYDDAVAFCEWAGFRLPADAELRAFFETVMRRRRELNWGGENWTSTPAGEDSFYVRNGPFHEMPSDEYDPYRKPLHRHHYQFLEAPSFRIVKT
ncbi:MAG: hypothetical protein DWQ37_02500 [Planctomycetota bacterium]|nr:MAG: hypothetical protein DWQ37_02500 [Planctomycetota bacterium]